MSHQALVLDKIDHFAQPQYELSGMENSASHLRTPVRLVDVICLRYNASRIVFQSNGALQQPFLVFRRLPTVMTFPCFSGCTFPGECGFQASLLLSL
jgi:hypothetical protein